MIFVNCCKFQGIDVYSPKLPCNHSNKPGEVTLALIRLAQACFFSRFFQTWLLATNLKQMLCTPAHRSKYQDGAVGSRQLQECQHNDSYFFERKPFDLSVF